MSFPARPTDPADPDFPRFPRIERDLSWLAFNHRVLQEAADPSVPPLDRLGFLAIFSSNLDEFFRVRVASLRGRARRDRDDGGAGESKADALLAEIRRVTVVQQDEFGRILRNEVVPRLAEEGIHLIDDRGVGERERAELECTFRTLIEPELHPILLTGGAPPFLHNRAIYLVAELEPRDAAPDARYGLVEIPDRVPRFVTVPGPGGRTSVLFVDDVIRLHIGGLFPEHRVGAVHSIKLSRDAELYLEDEGSLSRSEAIRRSLGKRDTGLPTRFLFDRDAPAQMVSDLRAHFGLAEADLVDGGRYHNLHDFHSFPRGARADLQSAPLAPLPHPELTVAPSILDAVAARDQILHLPYQVYDPVLRFLHECAVDPTVEEVWATLYRVAPESAVVGALVDAALAGKRVTAIVEVQARFDEAANLAWADRLEAAGVRTIHGVPGLKVHAKLLLAVRRRAGMVDRLACLSTGNFNERTARTYTDHLLFTAHPALALEVHQLFRFMAGEVAAPTFTYLLVAPLTLRRELSALLDGEIEQAKLGKPARAVLKMNSLEDPGMIDALYRASQAGVRIELIVRGICGLLPGVPGLSANVAARSLIDRFLEHGRIFLFHHGGAERCYLASSDWMTRNLDHRIEVAFPILDGEVRRQVRAILRLQLDDDTRARRIDPEMRNPYVSPPGTGTRRAQVEIERFLLSLAAPVAVATGSGDAPEPRPRPAARAVSDGPKGGRAR